MAAMNLISELKPSKTMWNANFIYAFSNKGGFKNVTNIEGFSKILFQKLRPTERSNTISLMIFIINFLCIITEICFLILFIRFQAKHIITFFLLSDFIILKMFCFVLFFCATLYCLCFFFKGVLLLNSVWVLEVTFLLYFIDICILKTNSAEFSHFHLFRLAFVIRIHRSCNSKQKALRINL